MQCAQSQLRSLLEVGTTDLNKTCQLPCRQYTPNTPPDYQVHCEQADIRAPGAGGKLFGAELKAHRQRTLHVMERGGLNTTSRSNEVVDQLGGEICTNL
jgi:hypothetical protein